MLKTLLENLFGSARKYTSGTLDAHIEFGAKYDDGETVCFVKDNGAGFVAYAGKLFQPFQRLHRGQTNSKVPAWSNHKQYNGLFSLPLWRLHLGGSWIGAGAVFQFILVARKELL